jgi:hypothetical protein
MARLLTTFAALLVAAGAAYAADSGRTPGPVVDIARPDTQCVAPADEMRRNHMKMLQHQRDRTLRLGERGARVQLNGCVECHASSESGSVAGRPQDFCESCHSYAAVKLDCFECHQPRAQSLAGVDKGMRP